MGKQVPGKNGRMRPSKLDHWRITSASKELLEVAAEKYGGTVQVWEDAPNEGEQFELLTESESLDILIPPNDAAFSQWMEMWSGGGCKKRCDGVRQVKVDRDCSCPKDINERIEKAKDGKACNPVTRFNVMLPDVPDAGVWRLETHGYNAATELAAFKNLVDLASAQGRMISAKLRIDHRMSKKDGETFRYVVPVVELSETMAQFFKAIGADLSDVPMTLPPTTERRSLPGGSPVLPGDVKPFSIDEADQEPTGAGTGPTEGASESGETPAEVRAGSPPDPLPAWINEAIDKYGEGEFVDAAEAERRARGTGSEIKGARAVANVPDDIRAAILARLDPQGAPTSTERTTPAPTTGTTEASKAKDPRVALERARHRVKGLSGFVTCLSRVTIGKGEPCPECEWDPENPEATLPIQRPCPICSSECKPWRPDDANKPSWLCTNDECDSDGEGNRWTSFHDDPWREPDGEIAVMRRNAELAEKDSVATQEALDA
ncbi:MAG: hypothetical protein GEU73_05115 [Chloroflexi bacterium]|nr:hypothetical protein [Chloroflexota bacterium]